jgi:serine O-acetyltransferase
MFQMSLSKNELQSYVTHQLNNFFPDDQMSGKEALFTQSVNMALERVEYCFSYVALKEYNRDHVTLFSHLHADQYTVFLWFLSNSAWRVFEDDAIASKLFCLNKALNGIMCMYDAQMPDIFLVLHGSGSVLGKASYSNFFVCCHGCTVGAVHGTYPVLNKGVAMAPNSTIVGECTVGPCSTIGTHALLRCRDLAGSTLYYRDVNTGLAMTKLVKSSWAQSYYNVPIL